MVYLGSTDIQQRESQLNLHISMQITFAYRISHVLWSRVFRIFPYWWNRRHPRAQGENIGENTYIYATVCNPQLRKTTHH